MELRVLICAAFLAVAAISDISEARHSMERRAADDDVNFGFMADGTSDSDTQNDAEGGEDLEEETVLAQIITQPTSYNTTVGSNIKLQCVVQPMIGVVVQWLKGKQQLFLGHSPTMPDYLKSKYAAPNDTNDLIIKDTNFNDSGEYECKIQQVPPTSIKHTLAVREAPRILRFTSEGTLVEGSDMLLTCNATGVPPPEIMWSRNGPDGNYRLGQKDGVFTANSVFIRNVQKEHSGKYYCYAFNIVGHNQAELTVNVRGKPRVHVHRTVINSAVNVSDILECSVHDEEVPTIRWLKDGVEVSPSATVTIETVGAHSNLTVTPASDGDFGLYTCEASNDFGTHKKSIQLVQSPVVGNFQADGPKLSWVVHSYQPLEAMELQLRGVNEDGDGGLVISVPVPETKARKYDIEYLLNESQVKPDKYVGFLKVKNSKGWNEGEESIMLEIVQQPQAIQHASVFPGNSGEIVRPASTVFLSTTLMYLLMRML